MNKQTLQDHTSCTRTNFFSGFPHQPEISAQLILCLHLKTHTCLGCTFCEPTTEVLSPDQRGPCTEPHLLVWSLQAGMRSCTSSGSVAIFTSDRALAQAEELTSHMKENTTVTIKSWLHLQEKRQKVGKN